MTMTPTQMMSRHELTRWRSFVGGYRPHTPANLRQSYHRRSSKEPADCTTGAPAGSLLLLPTTTPVGG